MIFLLVQFSLYKKKNSEIKSIVNFHIRLPIMLTYICMIHIVFIPYSIASGSSVG